MKSIIEGKSWYIDRVALPILRDDEKVKVHVSLNGEAYDAEVATIDDEDAEMKVLVKLKGSSDLANCTHFSFRLLDGDGLVYAYGWSKDNSSFAPLDDYGAPMWGCAYIEYFNEEKLEWEEL